MEICNVINFERIDQYLKEQKTLNIFEESIILGLASYFRERELFFLLKDSYYPRDIGFLLHIYRKQIGGKFSTHQIPRVAVANEEGKFLYQYSNQFIVPAFEGVHYPFHEGKDYITLHEDERVKIIAFLLKMIGLFEEKNGKKHILQDGFYVHPNQPSIILPYDTPYDYSYFLTDYPSSHYSELSSYYEKQRIKLKENLRKSIK